jgi:hypothetical protein
VALRRVHRAHAGSPCPVSGAGDRSERAGRAGGTAGIYVWTLVLRGTTFPAVCLCCCASSFRLADHSVPNRRLSPLTVDREIVAQHRCLVSKDAERMPIPGSTGQRRVSLVGAETKEVL